MPRILNLYNVFLFYFLTSSFVWFLAGIDEGSRLFVYTYLLSPIIFFIFPKNLIYDKLNVINITYALFLIYLTMSTLVMFIYMMEIDVLISMYRISIFPFITLLAFHYFKNFRNTDDFIFFICLYMALALISKIILIFAVGKFYGGGANQIYFYPLYFSLLVYVRSDYYRVRGFFLKIFRFKIVRYFLLLTIIMLTLLSFKRMTIVLMVLSLFIFILSNTRNKNTFYIFLLAAVFLGSSLFFLDLNLLYELLDRINSILVFLKNSESSISGGLRLYENLSVINELNKQPLLSWLVGLGPGAEYEALVSNLKRNASGRVVDVHSMYFYLLLNVGIVGTLAFLIVPFTTLLTSLRGLRSQVDRDTWHLLIGVKVTILMQLINGFTSNAYIGDPILALMAGWFLATVNMEKKRYF